MKSKHYWCWRLHSLHHLKVNGQCYRATDRLKKDFGFSFFFIARHLKIISMDLSREEELMKSIMKVSDVMITIDKDHACADYIKAYCFTVQICFFISVGMVCSFVIPLNCLYFSVFPEMRWIALSIFYNSVGGRLYPWYCGTWTHLFTWLNYSFLVSFWKYFID